MTRLARPLPLEYLIIELTTSHPKNPQPLLPGGKGQFPISNRVTSHQDFSALCGYVRGQTGVPFLSFMANFHLLLYLYTHEVAGLRLKVTSTPFYCYSTLHSTTSFYCYSTLHSTTSFYCDFSAIILLLFYSILP